MTERNERQISQSLRTGLQEFLKSGYPNILGVVLTGDKYLLVRTDGSLWTNDQDFEIYAKLEQKFSELPGSPLAPLVLKPAEDTTDPNGATLDPLKIRVKDYFLSHQEQVQLGGSYLNEEHPEPLVGEFSIVARSKEDEEVIFDQIQLKLSELREELAIVHPRN